MNFPPDDAARLRQVEGVSAESRWRVEALERAMNKTAELLERVERRVERMEWEHKQSAASVTRRQAIYAAVAVAVVSPTVATLLAHFVR